ncbi:patatin-like phospholipase family protein [Rhizobium ruizarguesonis]
MASKISAEQNIYLCLSGGGFRATFFHLGVIRSLRKNNLLGSVKAICAVSGGSIAAAHLVNMWADFVGDDQGFEAACDRLGDLARRDIRGRIIRRWLLTFRWWGYGRVKSLAKEYRRFFGSKSIADLYRPENTQQTSVPPDVHFLATSFTSGNPCSFSSDAFSTLSATDGFNDIPADLTDLDLAVAASSAFPPLFPPVWLRNDDVGRALGTDEGIYLTDGGVYDNLGIDYCSALIAKLGDQDAAILLSDAGGAFDVRTTGFSWILPRTIRTTDILMWRAATKTVASLGSLRDIPHEHISINQTIEHSALPVEVQRFVRQVRTDLDRFSDQEVAIIRAHGEAVADLQLCGLSSAEQPEKLKKMSSRKMLEVVKAARKRKWFNFADPATYILLLLPMLFVAMFYIALASYRTLALDYSTAQSSLQDSQQNLAAVSDKARSFQEQAVESAPSTPAHTQSDFTVFIQFAGFARSQVVAAAQQLSQEFHWPVPAASQGGERTGAAASRNEIRASSEEDRPWAVKLGDDLVKTGLVGQPPGIVFNAKIPPRTLEIWVGQK